MSSFYLNAYDGKQIFVNEWNDVENPVAVIQICHGMAEHCMRYDLFAKKMNECNIIVVADDHRAHGNTDLDNLGYAKGDIWEDTLKDMNDLSEYCIKKYNLPLILFGHSYGSFLSQAYMQRYSKNVCGCILGGSNYFKDITVPLGKMIAKIGCKSKGESAKAQLLVNMSFNKYNKNYDYGTFISSIYDECVIYEKDKLCGYACSYNFYLSFFNGVSKLYRDENAQGLDKNKPIMLISGSDDPVGNMGKGVKKLEQWYKSKGVSTQLTLFEGVRHEYLNDSSRQDCYQLIKDFCYQVAGV